MKNRDTMDKGRVKFRVIDFEVEGGNATIQEGLRAVSAALARIAPTGQVQPQPGKLKAASPEQLGLAIPDADAVAAPEVDVSPADEKQTPRAPRRAWVPNIINGLDLEGDPSLGDFIKNKSPDGHNATYLVAAVWLNEHKGIREFTADHAFTVYKRLGINPPNDAGKPLRKLREQRLLDKGEKDGTYFVNDAAKDKVGRMAAA